MKKIINIWILLLFLISLMPVLALNNWSDKWEFDYEKMEEPPYGSQAFGSYSTLNFSGKLDVQATQAPVFYSPNPSNQSTGVSISTTTWNITIEDPDGDTFSWTIQSAIENNGSINCINGSFNISMKGNLSYSTTYTIWVNASGSNTNATYWFTTEASTTFTRYATLNFSGNLNTQDVIGPTVTTNGSQYTEEVNSTLFGYLTDDQGESTTCWFQWNKEANDFTSPVGNASVGIQPQGTNFSHNASLDNGTLYYFRARANNSNGFNASANVGYLLTKPQPATAVNIVEIPTGFNVSWTQGDGYNLSYLVFNTYCIPIDRSNGTNIYTGPNNYYHHTPLTEGTNYYYRIWEYANRTTPNLYQWSDGNYSNSDTYGGKYPIFRNTYPINQSENVSVELTTWNVTIETSSGQDFNWTVQSSIGKNASVEDNNGSKTINITGNLSLGQTYYVWVNASQTNNISWTRAIYWFKVQQKQAPTISNPFPANQSAYISTSLAYWNVTINDYNGDSFNWSLTSPFGSNSSNGASNGSKRISIASGNLTNSSTYTIWVNVSDYYNTSNATYWFTTTSFNFTLYDTLSFGGKTDVQAEEPAISNEQPTNETMESVLYPWLNITVSEPQGENFNITWRTNQSGSWVTIAINSTCSGGTFRQRATWANTTNTKYYWTVLVNDSMGHWTNESYWFKTTNYSLSNWSTWWQFDYTCCSPTNLLGLTYSKTAINLSWVQCDSADKNVLVVNETGWSSYPLTPSNGTELYNGTNVTYNHTGLLNSAYYYYTIWGWNDTESNYSIANRTTYNKTFGSPTISALTPLNGSFYADRQPACRVWANDSDGNPLTVNFWNSSDGTNYHYQQTNNSVTANSTVYWKYTDADLYSTNYWWKAFVNDGETNTTAVFNFTTAANIAPNITGEIPENKSTGQQTTPRLNVTVDDDNGDALDVYWWSNSTGSWVKFGDNLSVDTSGGSIIIYQTNTNFSTLNTTYWWSVNVTDDTTWKNETYNFTTSAMDVCCPYPANLSTSNNRPPVNISVLVNGTNVDVYFYWINITPVVNTSGFIEIWTDNTKRYNYTTLWSNGWIWGNTNYTWIVRVTDGSMWINNTYYYKTKGSRYDVTNSDDVIITDVVRVWDNRAGAATYDGIYDVDYSGDIIISDVVDVWDNRS